MNSFDRFSLASYLQGIVSRGRKLLATYLVAGDPDLETTLVLIKELERAGSDIIEIGIPFSDPLADGITIQTASRRAREGGASLLRILRMVGHARQNCRVPLVLMSYFNPIHFMGEEEFFRRAQWSGVNGVIVPDLPAGERNSFGKFAHQYEIAPIYLVAPNTPSLRIREIVRQCQGFVYCVSLKGVTGMRSEIPQSVRKVVRNVRRYTSLPVLVGFGVSRPEQARWVCSDRGGGADGVVIGSVLVNMVGEYGKTPALFEEVHRFISAFRKVLE